MLYENRVFPKVDYYRQHPKDRGREYFLSVHTREGTYLPADGAGGGRGVPTFLLIGGYLPFRLIGGYLPWVGSPIQGRYPHPR